MTLEFPNEIVTRSLLTYIDLPGRSGASVAGSPGKLALITLDNGHDHTKPNTLGPAGLRALAATLDEVAASDAVAVAVTGKPFIFAAGADLTGVPHLRTREQAAEIAALGHDVLGRFASLTAAGKTSFAFLNGLTLGGGLEIALHCAHRTISAGVPAVALPEVFLGMIPGWGGAWLVPNLIGPERAVQFVVANPLEQNRTLNGPQTFALGLADALFEPADFLEQSIRWAAQVVRGDITPERSEPDRGPSWQAVIDAARAAVDAKLHGAAPAPYRALDLLAAARTSTREEGFAAEEAVLTDLLCGDELRAGLYAFDLVQRRAKRPAGAPDRGLARPITKVGVVGAGLMAGQLALLFARRLQGPVVLTDLDQERVDRGLAYVGGEIDKLLAKRRVSPDAANRLRGLVTGTVDRQTYADADLVIEAVFEEMSVKQSVFADLEKIVRPDCVLATNTSSLSVSTMAGGLQYPERVVGLHFFNPVAVLPLLEVIRGERTDDATLATALAVGKGLKKSCVLVRDAPAFVVNRLLTRLLGEILRSVDEGTPLEVADRALEPLGLPMSPFTLLELVGPAIALHTAETLHEAFPDRFYVSENLARVVAAGHRNLFVPGPDGRPSLNPQVAAFLVVGSSPLTADDVRSRTLAALADEISRMLDEGVVAAAQDIDLCMILGAGWPFALGGVTPYLDRTGVAEQTTGKRFLALGVASPPDSM